jgi:hypothetical protein
MATKNNNTLLYAGLGLAAFMLLRKRDDSELSGIGATPEFQIPGRVIHTEWRNNSNYGNPSYWVTIETPDGNTIMGYTEPNAMMAFAIRNPEYANEYHVYTYKVNKRGNVIFKRVRKM